MVKKRSKSRQNQPRMQAPIRKKRIKEADLYYSQTIAPLRRHLKSAQLAGNSEVIDEIWEPLQKALKHHRLLIDRAHYVERP
ncbi:hypothetical protein SAMN05444487_11762 [Marininema mesophilum]|uniref:Uncharacterized protein n=1 Tax=Marininema mesophilum TaxID=1048340 RepID=A0A1H3BPV6_9BACL|nr:hypothetical protein [Marininema mesophilum]SDX43179.1 hypothetical protein SAMN05444487_11762 [Marininema mesophilum]